MTTLPAGWAIAKLREIVVPSQVKVEPSVNPALPYVGLEHIETGTNRLLGMGRAADVKSTKTFFRQGDVLYGRLRPYLRKVCRPTFDGVCSTDILVFPTVAGLNGDYLLHFLSQQSVADYASKNSTGINIPRVNARALGELPFPLPPIAEQNRICERLNAVKEAVGRIRSSISELERLLAHCRNVAFRSAFDGTMTSSWRQAQTFHETSADLLLRVRNQRKSYLATEGLDTYSSIAAKQLDKLALADNPELPLLPPEWSWVAAQEVVEPGADIVYGIVQPGRHVQEGVPYIRGLDIQNGKILTEQLLRTDKEIAQRYQRSQLNEGDVLLGIIRATKVAMVPPELAGANITQGTARFRPSSIIRTRYLASWLDSPLAQSLLHASYRGIDMPGLNLRDVRMLPIPLAPLSEQKEIESRLAGVAVSIEKLGNILVKARAYCDVLEQTALNKAFAGELVRQDERDEPASALLQRIVSEKLNAKASATQKGRITGVSVVSAQKSIKARLLTWCQSLDGTDFSFDDIRKHLPGDYEALKEAIFDLLDDSTNGLKQYFDESSLQIRFRTKQS